MATQLKRWQTRTCAQHNSAGSANTEWAVRHMLSAAISTHALTTHRTAAMLVLISAPQIYNCDFIHKLAIIQWNQGCLALPEVTLDRTQQHMLYIQGYINIFQRR